MVGMIAELFSKEPRQWGLRGDPWLWRALQARFADTPVPAFAGELEATLREAFAAEVGRPLSDPAARTVTVERFAHGGMSSGMVSLDWWSATALPLLRRRAGLPGARFALRVTVEDDWPALRSLRLRNAEENPVSYGASLETTQGMTEDDWRLRARRGSAAATLSIVALSGEGHWLGTMGAQEHHDGGTGALLTGVFVVPEARGRVAGVADLLLGEVVAWASCRVRELRLWVDDGLAGEPARRFYARHGFVATGRRRPALGFLEDEIVEMVLTLPAAEVTAAV